MKHGWHVCRFDSAKHIRGKARTYEAVKSAVLEAGRFSVFEAQDNAWMFNRLCDDPELETLRDEAGFTYPWIGVRRRESAK